MVAHGEASALGRIRAHGVFATRSPFRPNPIGLTCVKIDHVELTDDGPIIHVLGADLRDGTPIFDIKPYIPFADCHPDATGGFIDEAPWHELDVDFPKRCRRISKATSSRVSWRCCAKTRAAPGSKHDPSRVYHLAFAAHDIAFTVDGDTLHVVEVASA